LQAATDSTISCKREHAELKVLNRIEGLLQ